MIQLAFTYTTSGMAKIHSSTWYSGMGFYYSMINDRFRASVLNVHLAQHAWIVVTANFVVMLWELLFCVTVWNRRLRPWVLLLGVSFHLGIYYFMSIRAFAGLFIALYVTGC